MADPYSDLAERLQPVDLYAVQLCLRGIRRMTAVRSELWDEVTPLIRRLKKALDNHDAAMTRQIVDEMKGIAGLGDSYTAEIIDVEPGGGEHTWEKSIRRRSGTRGGLPRFEAESGRGAARREVQPLSPRFADRIDGLDAVNDELEMFDEAIRRIPHMDIDADEPLIEGGSFTARVYLDRTTWRKSESGDVTVLPRAKDDTALQIGVWLNASAHFKITTDPVQEVILRPTIERSSEAKFQVEVVDAAPDDAGPPTLKALFDHRLRASGCVQRVLEIEGCPPSAPFIEPSTIALRTGPAELDMQITITRGTSGTYVVRTQTPHLEPGGVTVFDTWTLPADNAEKYVEECMKEFVNERSSPRSRQVLLRGAGIAFFSAAPRTFRQLYWRLVDADRKPRTILVISEEVAIPWELMIPTRDTENDDDQLPLGVECTIGRWYGEGHLDPDQWIPLEDSLVLAPRYESKPLPHAAAEQSMVFELFPGRSIPARFEELDTFLKTNSATLLHFACHGADATLQSLLLLNGEKLMSAHVRGGGLGKACRAKAPLVFLNACEVGRPGAGLASPTGFAASLVGAKCGAVIAPLWSVDDEVAHEVAVTFYEAVKDRPRTPFAEIIRDLRARAYQEGGADTYAAYCFYGHPLACAVDTADAPSSEMPR